MIFLTQRPVSAHFLPYAVTFPVQAHYRRNTKLMRILFFLFLSFGLLSAGMYHAAPKNKAEYDANWLRKNLVLIPQGTLILPAADEERTADTMSLSSFFLFNQEVSNGFYVFYLDVLLQSGDTIAYREALPDTLVWQAIRPHYAELYLRHPAYADYPAVGISYAQSGKFCEWLTQHYGAQLSKKGKKAVFSLPTRAQWMYAAGGKERHTVYPWGKYLNKGKFLANYTVVPGEESEPSDSLQIGFFGHRKRPIKDTEQYEEEIYNLTAPVKSYWANSFGLYQMAGNVSEFVREAGITKGGSWRGKAHYLRIGVDDSYSKHASASADRGFRFVMEITESE